MLEAPFQPHPRLRNAHVQSLLASTGPRRALVRRRARGMLAAAREMIVDAGAGVRLKGYYSPRTDPRGLVLLLHGWEGSVDSTYLLDCAFELWNAGYAVFRLNFRDHGSTEALNPGIFHSCRIDEVVGATATIAAELPIRPLLLAGFSLGGNFALRVALRAPAAGIELRHAIAVSPVISPSAGLAAIEGAPWVYEAYFMRKWRRSLKRKQALYPDRYRFDGVLRRGIRALTDDLVRRYTEFPALEDYLDGYSVAGPRLAALEVPVTIVTARDDPLIPLADFLKLELPSTAELIVSQFGGHCGFIRDLKLTSWITEFIGLRFRRALDAQTEPARETLTC